MLKKPHSKKECKHFAPLRIDFLAPLANAELKVRVIRVIDYVELKVRGRKKNNMEFFNDHESHESHEFNKREGLREAETFVRFVRFVVEKEKGGLRGMKKN